MPLVRRAVPERRDRNAHQPGIGGNRGRLSPGVPVIDDDVRPRDQPGQGPLAVRRGRIEPDDALARVVPRLLEAAAVGEGRLGCEEVAAGRNNAHDIRTVIGEQPAGEDAVPAGEFKHANAGQRPPTRHEGGCYGNGDALQPRYHPVMGARGDWQEWRWDESLFAGAAEHYDRGRLPYAPGLAEALAAALDLDGRGRLLDLGCGPGTVTLRLAALFESVVGLDPDEGMLREARRLAAERGVLNAHWVSARAETLPADLGSFRVVTLAASFHWMDRPRVAAAVRGMLEAGGAAVQVDAPGYRPQPTGDQLPWPAPPLAAIGDLAREFLGPDRRAGRGIRNTSPGDEDAVFRAAGFAPGERVTVPDGRILVRTIDDMVAETFSMSWTAPHLFGARTPEFEQRLRALLAEASPEARFAVRLPDNILTIWRPVRGG